MIKILFYISFSLIIYSIKSNCLAYNFQADTVWLIFDEPYNDSLPPHFRKCNDSFQRKGSSLPDMTGLSGLNISGSAEFSNKNLPTLINAINNEGLIVIDLRQETHGFVNGMAISWYGKYDWENIDLSREEIINGEIHKLDSLKKEKKITVTKVLKKDKATNTFQDFQKVKLDVASAETEQELTSSFKVKYFRITAPDHRKPTNENVDLFISYVTSLKSGYWLHFHCHGGVGRTTTFMAMYDMMKNAKSVSFHDIIDRQYLLGGINLTKDDDFPPWDKQYAIERTEFLKQFYEYCKTNNDGFKTLYSTWIKGY